MNIRDDPVVITFKPKRLLSSWSDMIQRCYNPKNKNGVRGKKLLGESLGKSKLKNIYYEDGRYRIRFEKDGKKVFNKSRNSLDKAIKIRDNYKENKNVN